MKLLISAVCFAVVFVATCYLISQHLYRTDEDDNARVTELKGGISRAPRSAGADGQRVGDFRLNEDPSATFAAEPGDREISPLTGAEPINVGNESEADDALKADELVSPFGFGPYPEIPDDYSLPPVQWQWSEEVLAQVKQSCIDQGIDDMDYLRTYELIGRVAIKLWNEEHRIGGLTVSSETGLFYPDYPNTVYVKRTEQEIKGAVVVGLRLLGSAASELTVQERKRAEELGEFPSWLTVLSMEDGIDPYEFLGLNR
jgi:hypothetical protein